MTARPTGIGVADIRVRRKHKRIPTMRLFFSVSIVGSTLLIGDAMVHAIRAGSAAPRTVEIWSGYGLFLTATTWLYVSENRWRSRAVTSALVVVATVVEVLRYFRHF